MHGSVNNILRPFQQRLAPGRIHAPDLEIALQQFQRTQPFGTAAQARSCAPLDIFADARDVKYAGALERLDNRALVEQRLAFRRSSEAPAATIASASAVLLERVKHLPRWTVDVAAIDAKGPHRPRLRLDELPVGPAPR